MFNTYSQHENEEKNYHHAQHVCCQNNQVVTRQIEKAKGELEETFGWLISELKNNPSTEKTIIFCQSLKACGDIYDRFSDFLKSKHEVAMYYSKTPQGINDSVLSDLLSVHGNIRLVIGTSAPGMGVNTPNVKNVIIFGVQESIEAYLQAVGRVDRDSSEVLSIMYYHGYHLCHFDPNMRTFVKNKSSCTRGEILQFFNEKVEEPAILHKCCDVCSPKCDCGACLVEIFKVQTNVGSNTSPLERQVTSDVRGTFSAVLQDLECTTKSNISVFGSVCFQDMLTAEIIKDLSEDLEHLFSVDYMLLNLAIFDE